MTLDEAIARLKHVADGGAESGKVVLQAIVDGLTIIGQDSEDALKTVKQATDNQGILMSLLQAIDRELHKSGSSSVELIAARGEYSNLNARLNALNALIEELIAKQPEWRSMSRTETIPFGRQTVYNDQWLPDESRVTTAGVDGARVVTWEEEFVAGKSTGKKRSEIISIIKQPVTQVWTEGTKAVEVVNRLTPDMFSVRYGMDLQKNGLKVDPPIITDISQLEAYIWDVNGGFRINSQALLLNQKFTLAFRYRKQSGVLLTMGGEADFKWSNHNLFMDGNLKTQKWFDRINVGDDRNEHTVYMHITVPSDTGHLNMLNVMPNWHNFAETRVTFADVALYNGHFNPFVNDQYYVVKQGDTANTIASSKGLTLAEFNAMNRTIINTGLIVVGQNVRVG